MSAEAATAPKIDGAYLRARLGSFLAVMPLGVWVLLHLWNNLAAFRSAQAWQTQVTEYSHPLAQFGTLVLVLLPLALHTVWGVRRLFTTRPNNIRYGFFANLKYSVQRLSAIGLLLFLGAHLWKAMLEPRYVHGHPETFADIAYMMHHHMPTLSVYLLGTLAVSYHLSNGLSSFAMGWGIVVSRRALKKLEWLTIGLFVLFLALSWSVIYALWAAGA